MHSQQRQTTTKAQFKVRKKLLVNYDNFKQENYHHHFVVFVTII